MITARERKLRFAVTAATLLHLASVGCKANRVAPTENGGVAPGASPGADASIEPTHPAPRWGSALSRFDDASPLCAALAARTVHQLDQIRDPFLSASPDQSRARVSAFRAVITAHTACVPGNGGAWATFFEGGADPRTWAWYVGYLGAGPATARHAGNFIDQVDARAAPATFTGKADLFDGATYAGPYRLQVVSDYDGDGTPEAVVWTAQLGQEVRSAARGVLWSFARGAVAPFRAAERLSIAPFEVDASAATEPAPLTDIDGDGRIDLLGYGPFFGVFKQGCGVIESFEALGPRLAWHALADGTFSESDEVARAYARRQCAARPARIVTVGERGVDQRATFVNLACARLWDVPARAIHEQTKSVCGAAQPPSTDCDAPRKCSSEALAVLTAWAPKKPPFPLR